MIKGHPKAQAVVLDASHSDDLEPLITEHHLVISLLPAPMHPGVARLCLSREKTWLQRHMGRLCGHLTMMHVKPVFCFLNELGLDPGIDHMSAMKIIEEVKDLGGVVTGFRSYCGGLPAPEANTNPWDTSFHRAPRGVLTATTNDARYLWNGKLVNLPGKDLFKSFESLALEGFVFEAYPNENSMPYADLSRLKR